MSKVMSIEQAMDKVKSSSVIMIGGFLACGTPEHLIDAVVGKGYQGLTVIANDTGFPDKGIGKLIVNRQVKKAIVSHVGTNPETGRQMNANELEVELAPQGTLIERIRAGGAGLGGVLTPTGVGTVVADGKQTVTIDGLVFLLEKPLRADVALLKAHKADTEGNLVFRLAARNFNPQMATAANVVIAEVENIVPVGDIAPDEVIVPGIFIHGIVKA